MISNEYGFNFIEIPLSGSELFLETFKESNPDCVLTDEKLDDCIEYHNMSVVKSPYLRASYIFRAGSAMRKEHDMKPQTFSSYFENNLNKWDTLEEDVFHSQYHYIKDMDDIKVFKYEELLETWAPLNDYLREIGVSTIKYFSEPIIKNWQDDYKDENAVELVEYIFEEDFENLGYSKL
tara:strand:+ start:288 stop:824 length:537 start_codon:yes stop_codon:yes gene_type:complete